MRGCATVVILVAPDENRITCAIGNDVIWNGVSKNNSIMLDGHFETVGHLNLSKRIAKGFAEQNGGNDDLYSLTSYLQAALAGHGGADDGGAVTDGGGGNGAGGCIPFGKHCSPAGPNAESSCCTGNCSFKTGICNCHEHDYVCKAAHVAHYGANPDGMPNVAVA